MNKKCIWTTKNEYRYLMHWWTELCFCVFSVVCPVLLSRCLSSCRLLIFCRSHNGDDSTVHHSVVQSVPHHLSSLFQHTANKHWLHWNHTNNSSNNKNKPRTKDPYIWNIFVTSDRTNIAGQHNKFAQWSVYTAKYNPKCDTRTGNSIPASTKRQYSISKCHGGWWRECKQCQ